MRNNGKLIFWFEYEICTYEGVFTISQFDFLILLQ